MPAPRIELGTSRSGNGRSDPLSYAGDEMLLGRRGDLSSVGVHGFEPRTFRSQSERATKLRHTPFRVVEADAGLGTGRGIRTPSPERPDLQSGAPRHLRRAGVVVPEGFEPPTSAL